MKKKSVLIFSIVLLALILAVLGGIRIWQAENDKRIQEERKQISQAYYDDKIASFEKENEKSGEVDVAFIGDSLTDGYPLSDYYPQYRTVNRGIGGDTTFGVEKRLKVSLYDVNPKVVVLLIGGNNLDTMFDNYESILQQIGENLPNSKVVLLSLTAMGKDWGKKNDRAILNNQKIKALAGKYGYTFVDLFTPLYNVETGEIREEYTTDGAHFTKAGYEVVTNAVTPILNELLNG